MLNYKAPENLLAGKTILITGVSSGIGRVAAQTYAHYGANVVLLGRCSSTLQALETQIHSEQHGRVCNTLSCRFDLQENDYSAYQALAEQIATRFNALDGLLLNAGILGQLQPLEHLPLSEWQQVLHVNLTANLLLVQALLPLLRQSQAASIIFTSSGVGRKGRANWGSYAISKFATEGMMQVLADEMSGTTIRVNAINPGATRTRMRALARPDEDPLRLKTAAEIMPLYLYLMGDDSSDCHGQSLDAQPAR